MHRFGIMSISFESALGIHEKALGFRSQRAEVLANNIANADTPNFKARDLDFASVLARQSNKFAGQAFAMQRTDSRHISAQALADPDASLAYREVFQPSIDQNTVDLQIEQASYAQNAVQFQASFTMLNSKFKGLMNALRGE
jgi:flagellar basal-body rod protein FlgB